MHAPYFVTLFAGHVPTAHTEIRVGETVTVGRPDDRDGVVPDLHVPSRLVSRKQMTLRFSKGGNLLVTDHASHNGTFVNGVRLPAHEETFLKEGDRITFGRAYTMLVSGNPNPLNWDYEVTQLAESLDKEKAEREAKREAAREALRDAERQLAAAQAAVNSARVKAGLPIRVGHKNTNR